MRPTMSVEIPLVLEIEKHECLYNFNLPEYNRKDILDQAWSDVATKLDLTVYECKDKWKNIRSSYLRSLKFCGKLKKPYYLTNYLQFVLPYLKPSSASIELNTEEVLIQPNLIGEDNNHSEINIKVEHDSDQEVALEGDDLIKVIEDKPVTLAPSSHLSRKRRLAPPTRPNLANFKNKHRRLAVAPPALNKSETSAMKYFLLSLLPECDSMNEEQMRLFKIKVMLLIDDIKTGKSDLRKELPVSSDNDKLQRRLINLLLRNLEKE